MTTAKTTTNRQDIERYIRVDHAGERVHQHGQHGYSVRYLAGLLWFLPLS